jgi:hypothetical protein
MACRAVFESVIFAGRSCDLAGVENRINRKSAGKVLLNIFHTELGS